jgi:hypothetical protein
MATPSSFPRAALPAETRNGGTTVTQEWGVLTNHARILVCIAEDPSARLRDLAARLRITERRASTLVTELTKAGYLVKAKDGRRNYYRVQNDLPLPEIVGRRQSIGEVLDVLVNGRKANRCS